MGLGSLGSDPARQCKIHSSTNERMGAASPAPFPTVLRARNEGVEPTPETTPHPPCV